MPRAVPEAGRLCVLGGGVPQRPVGSPACLDTCCGKWEFLMEKQAAQLGINLKYETFSLSRFVPEEFWRGQTQSVSGAPAEDTEAQK